MNTEIALITVGVVQLVVGFTLGLLYSHFRDWE